MEVKISVITITFNSEQTLEDTIKSVIGQHYDNLEYLIIDGGSKDGTLDIVEKYKDNISYVVSEKDSGISNAFNKGIAAATGEIVGIINSDDILLPNTLSILANNYDPNVDVYGFNVLPWNSNTGDIYREKVLPSTDFHNIYLPHNVAHPGRFIRKDAYNKYGVYDERLRYLMDHDLLVRFYRGGAVFKNINHDGALFRLGGATDDSIMKMKKDYKLYTINNGGTIFSYYIYFSYKVIRHWTKKMLLRMISTEKLQSLQGRNKQV